MDIAAEKKALRSALRRQRREIPDDERKRLDDAIFRNVTASPLFRAAQTLLLYVSCGGGVDTLRIIGEALRLGKQVAVPKCGENGSMTFYVIDSMDALAPGAYGIPEPVGGKIPEITAQTVCFVPGVAFTEDGERLGQGGGYYDRFLERYPELNTVGLCYGCMLQTSIPAQPHDRRVDAVIHE